MITVTLMIEDEKEFITALKDKTINVTASISVEDEKIIESIEISE